MLRKARWREAANSYFSRAEDLTGEVGTLFALMGYSNLAVVVGNGVETPAACLEELIDLRWDETELRGVAMD